MIVNPIMWRAKSLTPEIIVTAPEGSTLDLIQNGVVLQSYTLSGTETQHTFIVNDIGTYTVIGTLGSKSDSEDVLIETVGQYKVDIDYFDGKLYWYGDECGAVTGGWGYGKSGTANSYAGRVEMTDDRIYFADDNSYFNYPAVFTKKLIDRKKYTTMHCKYSAYNISGSTAYTAYVKFGYALMTQTQGQLVNGFNILMTNSYKGMMQFMRKR